MTHEPQKRLRFLQTFSQHPLHAQNTHRAKDATHQPANCSPLPLERGRG